MNEVRVSRTTDQRLLLQVGSRCLLVSDEEWAKLEEICDDLLFDEDARMWAHVPYEPRIYTGTGPARTDETRIDEKPVSWWTRLKKWLLP